jgi:hypothetical protein
MGPAGLAALPPPGDLRGAHHGEDRRGEEGQEDGFVLRSARLESVARALESAAVAPGAAVRPAFVTELDELAWATLVTSRRLRMLEWLAGAGMSVLNVLPGAERALLDVAERAGIEDKTRCARDVWDVMCERYDRDARIDQVARFELLLVWSRAHDAADEVERAPLWRSELAADHVDPRAAEAHELLPAHDVPASMREALLSTALGVLDGSLAPVPMIAAAGCGEAPGAVLAVEEAHLAVLEGLRDQPRRYEEIGALLGESIRDELRAVGVLVPCS